MRARCRWGGATGLTVDSAGNPLVVLMICEGYIDGITVWHTESGTEVEDLSVEATEPVTAPARVSLVEPEPPWQIQGPRRALDRDTTYTAYGWTTANEWSTGAIDFTLMEIADLDAGDVLWESHDGVTTGTAAEFEGDTC